MLMSSVEMGEVFDTLSDISNQRRQGLVTVESSSGSFGIHVYAGKIVGVDELSRPVSIMVAAKLKLAGFLSEEEVLALVKQPQTLEELYQRLCEDGDVPEKAYKDAYFSYALDRLYSIRNLIGVQVSYQPKVVNMPEEFGLDLSPGQLVLDIIELDSDEDFGRVFGGRTESKVTVARSSKENSLAGREYEFLEVLDEEHSIRSLYNQALVAELEFSRILTDLHRQGFISVKGSSGEEVTAPSALDSLELSADLEEASASEGSKLAEDASLKGEMVSQLEQDIEGLTDEEKEAAWNNWEKGAKRRSLGREKGSRVGKGTSIYEKLVRFNYYLLSTKLREMGFVFFLTGLGISLALALPGLFGDWFGSLQGLLKEAG